MRAKGRKVERSFPFLRLNERESKPRKRGLTEIRGPYYSAYGRRHLKDLFETMRSEEHTSELQSRRDLVCRLLLEKKKKKQIKNIKVKEAQYNNVKKINKAERM